MKSDNPDRDTQAKSGDAARHHAYPENRTHLKILPRPNNHGGIEHTPPSNAPMMIGQIRSSLPLSWSSLNSVEVARPTSPAINN